MTRIRELIEEKGVTQKQVAEDLGWPRRTLNNYVCDSREPDFASLRLLCDYFGVTADYMLGWSSFRHPAVTEEQATLLQAYEQLPLAIREAVDGLMAPYRVGSSQKSA